MNCGAMRINFCQFARGRPPPEMFVPDSNSLESACVPVYIGCASPIPCLPCSIAELHFQDPDDVMKQAMHACQRRYFWEVWNLVFGQMFPGESTEAQAESGAGEVQPPPVAAGAARGRKHYTISSRPGQQSTYVRPEPDDEAESKLRNRNRPVADEIAIAAQPRASFAD